MGDAKPQSIAMHSVSELGVDPGPTLAWRAVYDDPKPVALHRNQESLTPTFAGSQIALDNLGAGGRSHTHQVVERLIGSSAEYAQPHHAGTLQGESGIETSGLRPPRSRGRELVCRQSRSIHLLIDYYLYFG
jgi:hypothetical protein